ncbi:hypothetical protein A1353_19120 [Methylomonas methanica]|uniref:Uncharacterized protein n=1 Tax=Methylomonas methanica TaxID=421 RepID=A0A177M7A1_METMH|nr:hypothetical protein A1353_19120 [Methylomonas methanica]
MNAIQAVQRRQTAYDVSAKVRRTAIYRGLYDGQTWYIEKKHGVLRCLTAFHVPRRSVMGLQNTHNLYNIEEAELLELIKTKAVIELNIVQTSNKKYTIVSKLAWKDGVFTLVSYRKNVREWSTLDALFRYIIGTFKDVSIPIRLTFAPSDASPPSELTVVMDHCV